MTFSLPEKKEFLSYSWEQIQPYYDGLIRRRLDTENVSGWLSDWTRLSDLVREMAARLRVASVQDTTDAEVEAAYRSFLDKIYPSYQLAEQTLKEKLLSSGLEPEGFELPLKKMQVDAELFREENLPLETEESKNAIIFNKIVGGQIVKWDGQEYTITQLSNVYESADREAREHIWFLAMEREQVDRKTINEIWSKNLRLRVQQAANAGFDDYRSYRWLQLKRFDYSPEESKAFHQAIEQVVLPAANRIYERYRIHLGIDSVRPWDLDLYQGTYPIYHPPLHPYDHVEELKQNISRVFHKLDPQLGSYFDHMQQFDALDLENRKGKGPGGFCTSFPASRHPFIFMNAVGTGKDVNTLLHESGHAFHNYATFDLPYAQQRRANMEFNEVASMAMELLAAPYLVASQGGFYNPQDAARAQIRHLEKIVLFWPYMSVVDSFQHWVYENPGQAQAPINCDRVWSELWERFIPSIDYNGLTHYLESGWHRKRHIHRSPFYYIEYGLAQLGAVQIWGNALNDPELALRNYRNALSLGGTATINGCYAAAGVRFALDAETLAQAVSLIENTLDELASALS